MGAPRCGTTALFTYLSEHPQIYLPRYKELHFFAPELKGLWKFPYNSLEEYLALFAEIPADAPAIGEAASLYFASPTAAQNIYNYNPQAKLIISLRHPVDFVHSYHSLNLTLRREDEEDFLTAWRLYETRAQGKHIPAGSRVPLIVQYPPLGRFGDQLERILEMFPREQVQVILLEDIKESMREVYLRLEEFLGVEDDGRTEFPQINANFTYSSKAAQKLLHPSGKLYDTLIKGVSKLGTGAIENLAFLHKRITGLFSKPEKRDALSPAIYNEVLAYYREDIKKLSQLLERDLSHWLVERK